QGAARVGGLQHTFTLLPRFALEVLTVIVLTALVSVMLRQGQPLNALLPTLGLFAAAAFRIMPAANKIINAIQIVRNALPAVDVLTEELQALGNAPAAAGAVAPLPFAQALALDDVHYSYPGATAQALCGISLRVEVGTTIGIIGGSGAGKSTLVDI